MQQWRFGESKIYGVSWQIGGPGQSCGSSPRAVCPLQTVPLRKQRSALRSMKATGRREEARYIVEESLLYPKSTSLNVRLIPNTHAQKPPESCLTKCLGTQAQPR